MAHAVAAERSTVALGQIKHLWPVDLSPHTAQREPSLDSLMRPGIMGKTGSRTQHPSQKKHLNKNKIKNLLSAHLAEAAAPHSRDFDHFDAGLLTFKIMFC